MHKNDSDFGFSGALAHKIPRELGGIDHLRVMVGQLNMAGACAILGVHRTTMKRWLDGTRKVPRYAVLALYWHTPWGRGLIDSDHMQALNNLYQQIAYLKAERARLEAALLEYEKFGAFDSANAPVFTIKK